MEGTSFPLRKFKLIATYPNCKLQIGDIINEEQANFDLATMPHLFKQVGHWVGGVQWPGGKVPTVKYLYD